MAPAASSTDRKGPKAEVGQSISTDRTQSEAEVRRGHEVSLILTKRKVPRIVGLGNWTTIDAVNYVDTDAPPLLRLADLAVLLAILVSMVVAWEGAVAALFVPAALAYLTVVAIFRGMARKRLAWQVNWAIDFEARRTSELTQTLH